MHHSYSTALEPTHLDTRLKLLPREEGVFKPMFIYAAIIYLVLLYSYWKQHICLDEWDLSSEYFKVFIE